MSDPGPIPLKQVPVVLVLGHDLRLVATVHPTTERWSLWATTAAGDILGELGGTGKGGPSDGMLTIAAEQAMRTFPNHARTTPPAEEKYAAPHVFERDREKAGYVCKCGQDANTNIHGR